MRRRLHKLLCKQWKDFQERPSEDVRRAILLPEDESKPTFHWMQAEFKSVGDVLASQGGSSTKANHEHTDGSTVTYVPAGEKLFGGEVMAYTDLVTDTCGGGRLLDHDLVLYHLKSSTDCALSASVAAMVGASAARHWRGPLAIVACDRSESGEATPTTIVDIDLSGFTLALNRIVHNHTGKDVPIQKTRGLKLNILAPFIEEIQVPLKHPVFKSGQVLPITQLTKTPVLAYKYSTSTTTATTTAFGKSAANPAHNPYNIPLDTAALRICLDPCSPDFGKVPTSFHDDSASVLLACADRMPCFTRTLVPLSVLVKNHVGPELEKAEPDKESREEALSRFRVIAEESLSRHGLA